MALYICLCNALTDRDVHRAAEAGARRTREIYQAAGCEAQCGGCAGTVLCLLRKIVSAGEAPECAVAGAD